MVDSLVSDLFLFTWVNMAWLFLLRLIWSDMFSFFYILQTNHVQEHWDTKQQSQVILSEDTDIEHSHEEVRNHTYVCPLLLLGFSGCPVQSVENVLAKWWEQAVCHLTTQQEKDEREQESESVGGWLYIRNKVINTGWAGSTSNML